MNTFFVSVQSLYVRARILMRAYVRRCTCDAVKTEYMTVNVGFAAHHRIFECDGCPCSEHTEYGLFLFFSHAEFTSTILLVVKLVLH